MLMLHGAFIQYIYTTSYRNIKVCDYTIKRMGGFFSRSASSSKCVIVDLRKIEQKGLYFKCSSAAGVLDAFKMMMGK
jgi:hypothetical protein